MFLSFGSDFFGWRGGFSEEWKRRGGPNAFLGEIEADICVHVGS